MLRISRLTDYATVVLAALAGEPARLQTATSLAEHTHIAAPTVSKILKQLQRAGLVVSTRGTHGGYQLARPPAQISAAAILDALEGPVTLTDCAAGEQALQRPGALVDRFAHGRTGWRPVAAFISRSSAGKRAGAASIPASCASVTSYSERRMARFRRCHTSVRNSLNGQSTSRPV